MTGPYYQRDVVTEANAAAEAALLDANSSTSITIPAVGDAVGPIAIGTGKECPRGSKWKFSYTGDAAKNFNIEVTAYSSGNVYGICTVSNSGGSGPYDSWAAMHIGPPDRKIGFYAIEGLVVSRYSANSIKVTAGRIMSADNTTLLELPEDIIKNVESSFVEGDTNGSNVLVAQTGTVAQSASTTVTGTGTSFTTVFGSTPANCKLNDWDARAYDPSYPSTPYPIFTRQDAATTGFKVTSVASDTSMVVDQSSTYSGKSYWRGGQELTYGGLKGVCLGLNSVTGVTDIFTTSMTPDGEPDKPTNYEKYAVLALMYQAGVPMAIYQMIKPPGVGAFHYDFPAGAWEPKSGAAPTRTTYQGVPVLSFSGSSVNRARLVMMLPGGWDEVRGYKFRVHAIVDTGGASGHTSSWKMACQLHEQGATAWTTTNLSTSVGEVTAEWTANDQNIFSAWSSELTIVGAVYTSLPYALLFEFWRDPADSDDDSSAAWLVPNVQIELIRKEATDD